MSKNRFRGDRRSAAASCLLVVAGLAVAAIPPPAAGGPVNPDISVIGDIRASVTDAGRVEDELDLALHEVEIAYVGPVNPYASAEVYLGIHGTEGIEVEEAKLLLDRYLPGGFGLTVGRALLDFGQLNVVHSHAYSFLDRPLMHSTFFGDDGALDTTARLDWIAPFEAATIRATAGAVGGDVLLGGHSHGDEEHGEDEHGEDEHAHEEETDPVLGATGRIDAFFEPTADFSLLVGTSVLWGEYDPVESAKATWVDVDAKARWDLGPNRTLVANAEAVFGSLEEVPGERPAVDPWGAFGAVDLRLGKRWNVGGFAEATTERLDDEHSTTRWGGFLGYSLLEESTMFRLLGRSTSPEDDDTTTEVVVQALFGLGPHRAHRY